MLVERQIPLLLSLLTLQRVQYYCQAAVFGLGLLHGCLVPAFIQPHGFLKVNPARDSPITKTLN